MKYEDDPNDTGVLCVAICLAMAGAFGTGSYYFLGLVGPLAKTCFLVSLIVGAIIGAKYYWEIWNVISFLIAIYVVLIIGYYLTTWILS